MRAGVLYGIAAYGLWGIFPLYFPLLEPARPIEILAWDGLRAAGAARRAAVVPVAEPA